MHMVSQQHVERFKAEHHRFEVLSEVFAAFVETNIHQGKHYAFDALLEIKEKILFLFEYAGASYLATVDCEQWPDGPRVSIRLANGTFFYVPKYDHHLVGRHDGNDWVALSLDQSLSLCKSIVDTVRPRFDRAKVFYSFKAQKTEFLFYERDLTLAIHFEPGCPHTEDEVLPRSYGEPVPVEQ
ncbi:hypothetical protein pmac_cds_108 [Pandoravirus macleodensis]|uniref:Uncharacterized protein n=1 Tax=Pandoravirus macleodensis TaxID=2107707 RepID=A0A2U7UED2_9VIRU|nr:hypothetical protein pmac_cds_108 [Pandoravirus macleodensis]AVK76796.1 hypothetical protein pmac_cds_108 [Pandoravirus macleodensis]